MQALADVLEKAHVLRNDAQIVAWDGTRMLRDSARPRVAVLIREAPAAIAEAASFDAASL